jgi:hypothetical protein
MGPLRFAYSVVAVPSHLTENRGVCADLEGSSLLEEDSVRHEYSSMALSVTLSGPHAGKMPNSCVEFVVSVVHFLESERRLHLIKVFWTGPWNSEAFIPFEPPALIGSFWFPGAICYRQSCR